MNSISFNNQISEINSASKYDLVKMTDALTGNKTSFFGRSLDRITGKYTLKRLEEAYDSFFTNRKIEITKLGKDGQKNLSQVLICRAFTITEVKESDSSYRSLVSKVNTAMPSVS